MTSQAASTAGGPAPIPAFITKLWMLVEDKETDKLIKWNQDGTSFIVYDQSQFAKDVLPKYFKHNNMPSFVRQLNMYGFRKKFQPEQGGLIRPPAANQIEFHHPHFLKGKEKEVALIKRKIPIKDDLRLHSEGVNSILKDVKHMKTKQAGITGKLENIERENEALWREVIYLRKRHEQQQKIVTRLIQFLLTLAQQKNPLKRTQLPMIGSTVGAPSNAKYAKQMEDFLDTDTEPTGEQFFMGGATLSEMEDVPPDVLPGTTSELSPTEDLGLSIFPAFDNSEQDLELDPVGEVPIITSPGGGGGGDMLDNESPVTQDTGQILPVSISATNDSRLLMPHVPQEQPSVSGPPALQRALSVEEQRQEIGDQVTGIQNNLEYIQTLLENSPRLSVDNIWDIFRTEDNADSSNDFLETLVESNGLNIPNTSNIKGTEVVQYQQPSSFENTLPSTIFSEEDENLLLTSLDEDAKCLVTSDQLNEDESAAT
ncbi:heat shock factor protein-like isoform X2 [Apostichopus japonicus]|uniref:heat shock factor protein-like isoform X2 n=1 Tax=Stichopus japonicus TaxID=307972 RepID=UPI003AB2400B